MATNDELLYELRQSREENRRRLEAIEAKLNSFILFFEEIDELDDETEGMSVN